MNLLCWIFGHKPPEYAEKGWWSPGEKYARRLAGCGGDATGRDHYIVICECARCGKNFNACRIHLPKDSYKVWETTKAKENSNAGQR